MTISDSHASETRIYYKEFKSQQTWTGLNKIDLFALTYTMPNIWSKQYKC